MKPHYQKFSNIFEKTLEFFERQEKDISSAASDINVPVSLQKIYYPSRKGRVIALADKIAFWVILFAVLDTIVDILFPSQIETSVNIVSILLLVFFGVDYGIRLFIKGRVFAKSIWGGLDLFILLTDIITLIAFIFFDENTTVLVFIRLLRGLRFLRALRYIQYRKRVSVAFRKNIPYLKEALKLLSILTASFYLIIHWVSKAYPDSPVGTLFSLILNIPEYKGGTNTDDSQILAVGLGIICLIGINLFSALFTPVVNKLNSTGNFSVRNRLRESHNIVFILGDSSISEEIIFSLSTYSDDHLVVVCDTDSMRETNVMFDVQDMVFADPWATETWENVGVSKSKTIIFLGDESIDSRLILKRMQVCGCEFRETRAFVLKEKVSKDPISINTDTYKVYELYLPSLRAEFNSISSVPECYPSQLYRQLLEYLDRYTVYSNRELRRRCTEPKKSNESQEKAIVLLREILNSQKLDTSFEAEIGLGKSVILKQTTSSGEVYDENLEPLGLVILDKFSELWNKDDVKKLEIDIVYEVRDFRLATNKDLYCNLQSGLYIEIFAVEFAISLFVLHEILYPDSYLLWLKKDSLTESIKTELNDGFLPAKRALNMGILAIKKNGEIQPFVNDYHRIELENSSICIFKPQ